MTNHMSIPEKRQRAARVVAANAQNADDLAELLDMLGLSAVEGKHPQESPVSPLQIPAPRHPSEAVRDLATTLLAAVVHSLR